MTPRQLKQWAARLRERAGSNQRVLDACHRVMREQRGLPVQAQAKGFIWNGELDAAALALLREDDALGRIYQALNAPALAASYRATAREGRKFTDEEIPKVTQLFTPRWVVEFLLHNTLGRLWRTWHSDSAIEFDWLVDLEPAAPDAPRGLSSLRVLDPACGTMNFGLVAIDLLRRMYREEMDRAGRAGWPSEPSVKSEPEIPGAIAGNLMGADIDPVALRLAKASLEMKLGRACKLIQTDALFDSGVAPADVVVTNPPYLSARNLPMQRVAQLKRHYPHGWRDAYACFIERSMNLARPGGWLGLLTMHSFMFTGAFEELRRQMSEILVIETIAHFGGSLFGIGNPGTLQTVAFTAQRTSEASRELVAFQLTDAPDADEKKRVLHEALHDRAKQHRMSQSELHALPRGAWAYWTSPPMREAWRTMPPLGDLAPPRQGLATTDNARFVRYWWEVPQSHGSCDKWKPYAKGGQFRRWYQSPMHRVDWADDGAAIKASICARYPYLEGKWQWVAKNSDHYGREGITYSYLTSVQFSARWMPAGTFFDVAGSALFPDDPLTMLAILNSSAARELLHVINPTVNFQVGDLRLLPVPLRADERLHALVTKAIALQKQLDQFDETSPDFVAPMPWRDAAGLHASLHGSLVATETQLDEIVCGLYGMRSEFRAMAPAFDPADLARRSISFAVHRLLNEQTALELCPISNDLRDRIRTKLGSDYQDIETAVGGLNRFLAAEFLPWHTKLYKRRPRIWGFGDAHRMIVINHRNANRETVGEILSTLGAQVPARWDRFINDGIQINLAPLHAHVREPVLRKHLRALDSDLREGRYAWSQTAQVLAEN